MKSFSVLEWGAWAPGLPKREDWNRWLDQESPDFTALDGTAEPTWETVPPRMWRRCGHFTRLGLVAALQCCEHSSVDPGEVQMVWATRHGEVTLTISLLSDLARDELLSPMGFANSVPNTAAAYFGILQNNTLPTHTLCTPPPVFPRGCLDALGMLGHQPEHPVLLVQADGLLPAPLQSYNSPSDRTFGLALLLDTPGEDPIKMHREALEGPNRGPDPNPVGPAFLHWIRSESPRLVHETRETRWSWVLR